MTATDFWPEALAAWAIPPAILEQAPESPWIHPPALFGVPDQIPETPSHQRAREGLRFLGSVLDVGCGGGIAAFAIAPPAKSVWGVDHQAEMLSMFEATARQRKLEVHTTLGDWPDVAQDVPSQEVVTCHHVVYNVSDIEPFLRALDSHATSRVVIEMPTQHPLSNLTTAWSHFWDLQRPTTPGPRDLLAVLDEMGISAQCEFFSGELRNDRNIDEAAHYTRIRLCLPASRESEVKTFLQEQPPATVRELATIWWDV